MLDTKYTHHRHTATVYIPANRYMDHLRSPCKRDTMKVHGSLTTILYVGLSRNLSFLYIPFTPFLKCLGIIVEVLEEAGGESFIVVVVPMAVTTPLTGRSGKGMLIYSGFCIFTLEVTMSSGVTAAFPM
mgnify:CR=1 FL=1